jgi:DNA-directed RNA polymerase II subunit RPB4
MNIFYIDPNISIITSNSIFSGKQNLHKFEVAQIANLCPENAEEAKALIPRSDLFFIQSI